ncbi:MAG: hypothetical protein WCJ07_05795 [Verrucomicrobiota bacterium]
MSLVLLLNALAAAPTLHELFHADAGETQHLCGVTLFAQGQVDAADAVVAAGLPPVDIEFPTSFPVSVFSIAKETLPPGRAPPVSSCNS